MLSKFKNLVSQKPNSKKLLLIEAQSYLETETAALTLELDATPEDRLPSRKLASSIKGILDRVDAILFPIEKQCHDLENYSDWLNLDLAFRVSSFERYATLIGASESITPFATLSEIQKIKDGGNAKISKELNASYQSAVKSLFCHPLFVQNLIDRVDKKIKILGETANNQTDLERKKIQLFSETYSENKKWNSVLARNALLEDKMAEMEAIIFLHTQTAIIATGEHRPTADLADYINYWMVHLNELTAEQQTQKMVLLQAADTCSAAYNSVV